MAFSEWTVEVELGEGLSTQVSWVVVLTEVEGPGSNGTDVETKILLVWGRGEGERVELARILSSTGNFEPLTSLVVKRDWPLEVDSNNLRWQDIGTNNGYLVLPTGDADEQINGIDDSWSQEEVAEQRILDKTTRSMEEGEDVEDNVQVVSVPESLEGVASGVLRGKYEDDDSDQSQHKGSKTSHRQEEPVRELGQGVGTMVDFTEDAGQVVGGLSGDVVKVDTMTDAMHNGEE